MYAGVNTEKMKKRSWFHLNYGIRVSYFQLGFINFKEKDIQYLIVLFIKNFYWISWKISYW